MKKKRDKRKILLRIVIYVLIVLGVTITVCYKYNDAFAYLLIERFVSSGVRESHQMRVRLLCKTDHQALLEACREILKQDSAGETKPGTYQDFDNPAPEVSHFPKPILELEPVYIYIDKNNKGSILLAMAGGLDHFGLIAYSEDYKPLQSDFQYGDRELIPGLWYYDEGYSEYYKGPSKYDEIIDSVIKTGKWP